MPFKVVSNKVLTPAKVTILEPTFKFVRCKQVETSEKVNWSDNGQSWAPVYQIIVS